MNRIDYLVNEISIERTNQRNCTTRLSKIEFDIKELEQELQGLKKDRENQIHSEMRHRKKINTLVQELSKEYIKSVEEI